MPPGPGYNWICVLSSAAEIVGHAARYRASQLTRLPRDARPLQKNEGVTLQDSRNGSKETVEERWEIKGRNNQKEAAPLPPFMSSRTIEKSDEVHKEEPFSRFASAVLPETSSLPPAYPMLSIEQRPEAVAESPPVTLTEPSVADAAEVAEPITVILEPVPIPSFNRNTLQSSRVPSSKLGRLFHYGGLAASLGYGAASELLRPTIPSASDGSNRSVMLSDANISRLVSKLSQMRGAALKLGQFLSIQDTHLLPTEIDAVFRRVQDSAHYMPDWQMDQVLTSALGSSWSPEYFDHFNRIPFAAASIGQVHEGVLKAEWTPTGKPEKVAVKVQFPNIRDSISADLSYITWLGLFLDRTMEVMKSELADECDYVREAHFLQQFRSPEFLGTDSRFHVPWAASISSDKVLVMEFVEGGVSLGSELVTALPQEQKDEIAATILHLCLLELFRFGTMQTDPNYSNFLYVPESGKIALIDFGATREYGPQFLDGWRKLLEAAASLDLENVTENNQNPAWEACVEESISLGYLIGGQGEGEDFESPEMVKAHVTSLALLAYPFNPRAPQPVRFGKGSEIWHNTEKIRELIPLMLRERKKGPPKETYSLNRKLSGAFLLASRLGATVHTRNIWEDVLGGGR
ncbi:ABC1 family-domain-containing protein [Rhodocollybia butyracea]|uniref:ABC1 family-domain-containing protein n=1 Tax=Rhodocollybia butyracea TaxID=206335 RepID=A0A9P5PJX6_9AGAR|nr:ABC1 family-domain-containing protein [Rhodocollybia butyracea]